MSAVALIGHLDADAFYVSAERVRDPFLLGKQVAVLGNQGACVIAKSYEMKAAGVKTGEPIWEAKEKCPEAIFIKRDFRWYEVLSRAMHDMLCQFSPTVEYYSVDGATRSLEMALLGLDGFGECGDGFVVFVLPERFLVLPGRILAPGHAGIHHRLGN